MNERIEELHERLLAAGEVFSYYDVAEAITQAVNVKSARYGTQINPALDGIWHNIVEPEALDILGIDNHADVHPEWVA